MHDEKNCTWISMSFTLKVCISLPMNFLKHPQIAMKKLKEYFYSKTARLKKLKKGRFSKTTFHNQLV